MDPPGQLWYDVPSNTIRTVQAAPCKFWGAVNFGSQDFESLSPTPLSPNSEALNLKLSIPMP